MSPALRAYDHCVRGLTKRAQKSTNNGVTVKVLKRKTTDWQTGKTLDKKTHYLDVDIVDGVSASAVSRLHELVDDPAHDFGRRANESRKRVAWERAGYFIRMLR